MKVRTNLPKTIGLLIVASLILSAALVGDTKGKLRITVKNSKGDPIPGAKITLVSTQIPAIRYQIVTKDRGIALHGALENHYFEITIEKEGYQALKKTVKIPARELQDESVVLLTQEEAVTKEGAGDPHTQAINKFNQAAVLLNREEYDKALPLLRESIALDDTIYQSHMEIARIFYIQGNCQEAVDHLQKVISLNKEYSPAYRLMAGTYEKMGNKEESDKYANLARGIGGATGVDKYNEALDFYNANDIDSAIPLFEEAVKLDNKFAPPYYYLGLAYTNKGENEKAIANLEKFLELQPEGANSENARSLLKFLKGKKEERPRGASLISPLP